MAKVIFDPDFKFDIEAPVAIIGAGAAGLTAALACREVGVEPVLFERDPAPRGSTAMSAGLIPAPGSRWQAQLGLADDPQVFLADVARKTKQRHEREIARLLAYAAAPTLEWLADVHKLPFTLVADVDFPGHSVRRLHGLPTRSGGELMDHLRQAVEAAGIPILCEAKVHTLVAAPGGAVAGLIATRSRSGEERIGCRGLVLACNGYGGNRSLVERFVPAMRDTLYFGHPGNQGDAVVWGEALGADLRCMTGYQGHGSVAHPHGILISWVTMMEGGFQVNILGRRFSDESLGYSEQAALVAAQPGAIAWSVFDERIAALARQFQDFQNAELQGAVLHAPDMATLADRMKTPPESLAATFADVAVHRIQATVDAFGRKWGASIALTPPFRAVRVTGALFHTQGGLAIDDHARVLRKNGSALANLFACGGAAVGISGPEADGYLSGNGLLSAVVQGRIAGKCVGALATASGSVAALL